MSAASPWPRSRRALMASVFISRWDKAVMDKTPHELRDSWASRWPSAPIGPTGACSIQSLSAPGQRRARAQRLLWASTGTKDPEASDILYVMSLAAPNTVNTMPKATLLAFANHGEIGPLLTADENAEEMLARFERAGIDVAALAGRPPARGRQVLRRFLERADGWHGGEERNITEGRLSMREEEDAMTCGFAPLTRRPEWRPSRSITRRYSICTCATSSPRILRAASVTAEAAGLYFDYSKHRITDETLGLLVQLAEACGLRDHIDAMFRGDKINTRKTAPCCMWRCAHRRGSRSW